VRGATSGKGVAREVVKDQGVKVPWWEGVIGGVQAEQGADRRVI
jgi:hypothetical protein